MQYTHNSPSGVTLLFTVYAALCSDHCNMFSVNEAIPLQVRIRKPQTVYHNVLSGHMHVQ